MTSMVVAVSPKVGICPVNHLKQDPEELQKRIELLVDGPWAICYTFPNPIRNHTVDYIYH